MDLSKKERLYFPNLNSLRFIAALFVIIHHIEQFKNLLGFPNYWNNKTVYLIGKLGVVLFFVLSGFLITYLLIAEQQNYNRIDIKKFYIRRMLRIWPLYYLLVLLSFVVLNQLSLFHVPALTEMVYNDHLVTKLLLFIFFMPNAALIYFSPAPYLSQAWSIGVEEQFYLIWPFLLSIFKFKRTVLVGIILFYVVVKLILIYLRNNFFHLNLINPVYNFWNVFNIDLMAIGGLMAYAVFYKSRVLNFLFHRGTQLVTFALTVGLILFGISFKYFYYEIYSLLFSIIVINLAANPNRIINIENKVFNYLGKISYGIYMYHSIAIVLVLRILNRVGQANNIVLQYFFSLLLTVLIAGISYKFFEERFIKYKSRFSLIATGSKVSEDVFTDQIPASKIANPL